MVTDITTVRENWVYQSNRLIEASYTLTLLEQKIIRVLASMINRDDEELKEYRFNAADLSKLLNIHKCSIYKELDKITDRLMTRYIKVKNDDSETFKKRHLIKFADFENGVLSIKIDDEMKEFYLKLNWFTRYQLKYILQFKSTYSFRLYELLKQYEKIGYRILTVEEIRTILEIESNQYPKYSNLKQKVINVAVNELNKTDLIISFEEIKTGKKVTAIKFIIISKNAAYLEAAATEESIEDSDLIAGVKAIFTKHKITVKESRAILKSANNNLSLIKQCYDYTLGKDVENVVGYVISIVKDFKAPQENRVKGTFNSFEQRVIDFDELERKLLKASDVRYEVE